MGEFMDWALRQSDGDKRKKIKLEHETDLVIKQESIAPNHLGSSTAPVTTKWSVYMEKCIDATPLILSEEIESFCVIGSHSGKLAKIKLSDGNEVWSLHLPDRIESSPAALTDSCVTTVVVGCYDGFIYFVSLVDGRIIDRFETKGQVKCSPAVRNNVVYCGSHDGFLYSLMLHSNKVELLNLVDMGSPVFASPCLCETGLLCCSIKGRVTFFDFELYSKWSIELGSSIFGKPMAFDGKFYFGLTDGRFVCLTDKGRMDWSILFKKPIFGAASLIDSSSLVVGTYEPSIVCISLNGSPLWTIPLSSPVFSKPCILEDGLIVAASTDGTLAFIKNGHVLLKHSMNGMVFSSPVFHENGILVACRNDFLYYFDVNFSALS